MELISSPKYIKNTSTGCARQRQAGREGRRAVHVSPQLGYLPDTGGGPLTTRQMAEIPAARWDVGGARIRGEVEASRDGHTWGAATGWEWLPHPERSSCLGASAEGRRHPGRWRAGLGVPFPHALGPGSHLGLLSSSTPLPELVLGAWEGTGRRKIQASRGSFPGLEDQGPPWAAGLILHSPRPEALQTPSQGPFLA